MRLAAADYRAIARARAREHGIDPDLFERQIDAESGFDPHARSARGAIGIAQLMPARARYWDVDPSDPVAALEAAARGMAAYLRCYAEDWRLALAAYNAGPASVRLHRGVPPFEPTHRYLFRILGDAETESACWAGTPQVAFTFDDAPRAYVQRILDLLGQFGARGTFFVVGGQVCGNENLLRAIVDQGHEIGNHTYTHPRLAGRRTIGDEIRRTNSAVESATGVRPRLFRPPYCIFTDEVIEAARDQDMVTVRWTIDTRDWSQPGVQAICREIADGVDDGSIILMHDGRHRREQTCRALSRSLVELHDKGYEFSTASELIRKGPRPGWAGFPTVSASPAR